MCGRFTNQITWRELVELYRIHDQPALNLRPRYNVAPSQDIPIVQSLQEPGRREVTFARWGLVPSWATDLSIGYQCINAKAETVADKPAFSAAFKARRCLIPADGFYEWKKIPGGGKQPYRIVMADRRPFAFAGLWEENPNLGVTTCTILTTQPNAVVAELHDRMPAILHEQEYDAWLSPDMVPEITLALLRPYSGEMVAYPVSPAVGSPRNDSPELIEPLDAAGEAASRRALGPGMA